MAELETLVIHPEHGIRTRGTPKWSCPIGAIRYAAKKARVPLDEETAERTYVAMYEDYLERSEVQRGKATPPFTVFVLDGGADKSTPGCWCRKGVDEAAPHHTLRFIVRLEKGEY